MKHPSIDETMNTFKQDAAAVSRRDPIKWQRYVAERGDITAQNALKDDFSR